MALSDDALFRLAHLNHCEFGREVGRWAGAAGRLEEHDGLLMWSTGSSFPVVANAAMRLHPGNPEVALDVTDAFFGARSRGYSLALNEHDGADDDLAAAARARGFTDLDAAPEMVRRTPVEERPLPDGIELRWVGDVVGVADFVAVDDAAYQSLGMAPGTIAEMVTAPELVLEPHLHAVVAYDDNRPVAAALTLLSHGIAGVYYVGVVPDARGRGLADLVTRTVTNRGFDAGAAAQTLQASPMGHATYLRMGWEEIYRVRTLARFTPPGG